MVHQSLETVMEQMSATKGSTVRLHVKVWKQSVGSHEFKREKSSPSLPQTQSRWVQAPLWGCSWRIPRAGWSNTKRVHTKFFTRTPSGGSQTQAAHTGLKLENNSFQLKLTGEEASNPPSPRTRRQMSSDGFINITHAMGGTGVWRLRAHLGYKESDLKQSSSVTPQIGIFNDRKTLNWGNPISFPQDLLNQQEMGAVTATAQGLSGHRLLGVEQLGGFASFVCLVCAFLNLSS